MTPIPDFKSMPSDGTVKELQMPNGGQ